MLFQTGDTLSLSTARLTMTLPDDAWVKAAVIEALRLLTVEHNWQTQGALSVEAAVRAFSNAFATKRFTMQIGDIVASVSDTVPDGYLPCDGQIYDNADYPELAAVIHIALRLSGDRFKVPDLRHRTVIGTGNVGGFTLRQINNMGGEEAHMQTYQELFPHNHQYVMPVTTVELVGAGAPLPTGLTVTGSFTGVTPSGVTQQAMNVMQPFTALPYYIVAR